MGKTLSFILIVLLFGCAKPKVNLETYFDLKEVLQDQVILLSGKNAQLEKTVDIEDLSESKILVLDSLGWVSQFDIITEFSLTEPALVGAFDKVEKGNIESYTLKGDSKASLKSFRIETNGDAKIISGILFSDKTIYVDFKELKMTFENDIFSSYEVSGYQKMAMKDTTKYSIKAKVLLQ